MRVSSSADAATNLAGRGFARRRCAASVIVALNTDVYSIESKVRAETAADPRGQAEWLEAQLAAAEDAGSVEADGLGHIPPALDSHENGPCGRSSYAARYWKLLVRYSATSYRRSSTGTCTPTRTVIFDGDASRSGAPPSSCAVDLAHLQERPGVRRARAALIRRRADGA